MHTFDGVKKRLINEREGRRRQEKKAKKKKGRNEMKSKLQH